MEPHQDVGSVQEEVQKNLEEYLAIVPADEEHTRDHDRAKRELLSKFEKVYAMPSAALLTQVHRALYARARQHIGRVYRDTQGFSAYRFNLRVMEVRKGLQQSSDLVFQPLGHLRNLYIQEVLKLSKRV